MSKGPIIIASGHPGTEMHRVAMNTIHLEEAVPIVEEDEFESFVANALSEEGIYVSGVGEIVIPAKHRGLRTAPRSGKMDCYKASE